ncbi:reverse transcriptase domain-containing protein [Tanacetum coccineum]
MPTPTDKVAKRQQRCFYMAAFRYDWGPEANHPTLSECQFKCSSGGTKAEGLVSREEQEAYMDDMVIKNNTEQEMSMDIAKTLDNLWNVKMKLNPNKCSFGVKEGKFLGYMVTSEGIRANHKKTKAVEDMQSPSTLKEMQSLSGKLAALNHFLYRWVVKSQGRGCRTCLNDPTVRLRITRKIKVRAWKVKVDSKLVACHLNGEFVASIKGMTKYLTKAKEQEVNMIIGEEGDNWMTPIIRCLEEGIWPENENEARTLRMKISQYVMKEEVLFKKSYTFEDTLNIHRVSMVVLPMGPRYPRTPSKRPRKLKFIIMAIDYFTKSMEAKPLAKTTCKEVKKFVWENIVCRFKIKQMNTTVAHPQANGLVKRANKSLMHGLKARLGRERAVILAGIGMPTYRTIQFNEALNEEEMWLNLDLIQERRETTAIREAKYKKKVEQYYNKRVRPVSFKVGDFVYQKNEASRVENQGKLGPNWEGPYRVVEAYHNGS